MAYQYGFDFYRAGAALALDAAPTTPTSVAETLTKIITLKRGVIQSGYTLRTFALDGTTISVEPWILFTENGLSWVQIGAAFATTPTAPGSLSVAGISGAKLFLRVTVLTGVTKFGFVYGP